MGFGGKRLSAQNKGQGRVLLASRSLCRNQRREFAVSRKDVRSEELETLQKSMNPTKVITGDVEVQTSEEAQVYVHDLDLLVTVNPRRHGCSLVIGPTL